MEKKEIKPGDVVQYIDTQFSKKKRKNVKVAKQGIWDGEKVVLNDKEQTTVRNLDYLTLFRGVYIPFVPIERKIIDSVVFEKDGNNPILWKDWKHIKLEDNDDIRCGYIDPYTSSDNDSGGDYYTLKITRKRLETEEEAIASTHREEINKKMMKSRRYETYLRLKEEFENGNPS